jgi:TPR repeat protein
VVSEIGNWYLLPDSRRAVRVSRWLSELKLAFSNPDAQLNEAVRRWNAKDQAGAFRWGRRAAKRLPFAKVVVAQWLLLGKRGAEADREAIDLLTSAAEANLPEAQQVLAARYLFGEGVEKNPQKAIELTRRRADGGDVSGQIAMVRFLTLGEYCEPDVEQALHYATLAAEAGHSETLAALTKDLQDEKAASSSSSKPPSR